MSRVAGAAAGAAGLITMAYALFARPSSARVLEEAGRAHAGMIRAMLGPIRCDEVYPLAPVDDQQCIWERGHVPAGLHCNRAGFAWSDEDRVWAERQLTYSAKGGAERD